MRPLSVVLAIATIAALLSALYRIQSQLTYGRRPNVPMQVLDELVAAYSSALLLLLLLPFIRKLRIRRSNLWRVLPAHAGLLIFYSALHTLAMWLIRTPLYPILGFGRYEYGSLPERFVMELAADVVLYTLFVGAAHTVWIYFESKEKEEQLVRAQLDALRSQLQPHFLFNSLNAISNLVYEDPRRADEMIGRLSEMLRRTLQMPPVVPLEEEIRTTELYLDLMQIRFEDRLRVAVDVASDTASTQVPHLLLQPLVENCLRHGVDPTSKRIDIRVAAERDDGRLRLSVADNGPGFQAGAEGIGLANTRERLAKLFGGEATLRIGSVNGHGCICEIEIPCGR
jgi:signal transduction histidine kinase